MSTGIASIVNPFALLTTALGRQFIDFTKLGRSRIFFRASASVQQQIPTAPRSLFAQPRPRQVGDIITILIDENSRQTLQFNFQNNQERELTETGTGVLNNVIQSILGRLPISARNEQRATRALDIPSISGIDNQNELTNQAIINRNNRLQDSVTVQSLFKFYQW